MKKFLLLLLLMGFTTLSFADKIYVEALAQSAALDMMHKGYKHVTGLVVGKLKKGEADYQTLTLYKGVNYSFGFGADKGMEGLKLEIYNENFDLIKSEKLEKDGYKMTAIADLESGPYYVKLSAANADIIGSHFFFHYSYK